MEEEEIKCNIFFQHRQLLWDFLPRQPWKLPAAFANYYWQIPLGPEWCFKWNKTVRKTEHDEKSSSLLFPFFFLRGDYKLYTHKVRYMLPVRDKFHVKLRALKQTLFDSKRKGRQNSFSWLLKHFFNVKQRKGRYYRALLSVILHSISKLIGKKWFLPLRAYKNLSTPNTLVQNASFSITKCFQLNSEHYREMFVVILNEHTYMWDTHTIKSYKYYWTKCTLYSCHQECIYLLN